VQSNLTIPPDNVKLLFQTRSPPTDCSIGGASFDLSPFTSVHGVRRPDMMRSDVMESGTADKYSNLAVQHRLHATDVDLRPALMSDIDLYATRSQRGGRRCAACMLVLSRSQT
jgi:hypothetical protein